LSETMMLPAFLETYSPPTHDLPILRCRTQQRKQRIEGTTQGMRPVNVVIIVIIW
jgi:hypothetical protein